MQALRFRPLAQSRYRRWSNLPRQELPCGVVYRPIRRRRRSLCDRGNGKLDLDGTRLVGDQEDIAEPGKYKSLVWALSGRGSGIDSGVAARC